MVYFYLFHPFFHLFFGLKSCEMLHGITDHTYNNCHLLCTVHTFYVCLQLLFQSIVLFLACMFCTLNHFLFSCGAISVLKQTNKKWRCLEMIFSFLFPAFLYRLFVHPIYLLYFISLLLSFCFKQFSYIFLRFDFFLMINSTICHARKKCYIT